MRIDLPDELMENIRSHAEQNGRGIEETIADLLRTGLEQSSARRTPAPVDRSTLQRRADIAEKFLSGEWCADLNGFEEGRLADRDAAAARGSHPEHWT